MQLYGLMIPGKSNITPEKLAYFFEVMETIDQLISEKKVFIKDTTTIKSMNKHINKVAVIGSGIMGSGIACHFANIGVEVLLLDIVPRELNDEGKSKRFVP